MRKTFVTVFLLFVLGSIFLVPHEMWDQVFSVSVLFGFFAGFIAMYRVLMRRTMRAAFGFALGISAVVVGLVVFNAYSVGSPIVDALAYLLTRFGQASAIPVGCALGLFAGTWLAPLVRILEQEDVLYAQDLSK